ncbi:Crp/Fnr family transcriptional regulator [Enterococcus sp. CWB-B31]|uniref:Crp/Fnr family transcriptional regulator n=1 Tax=Enterococcus sp. CWB-B31 TaxID=2885159 RepID=UPI001E292D9F|nr:Crp/Fnr family transcriptional regulator [Enterococcus sp. CWB-B31]MCB5954577.1 Crp/Fnr family transcriptional regulator [Enterococcus sp. CWB-B31]
MEKNVLREKWQHYNQKSTINFSSIENKGVEQYPVICFEPKETIIMRGDFPEYVYFILSGIVVGARNYEDGNEYDYFQLEKSNGSVGLLEILAQKEETIATITCLTKVEAVRVPSSVVYEWVMEDIELLQLSAGLLAKDLYDRSGNDGLLYRFEGVNRLRYFLVSYYEEKRNSEVKLVEVQETREKIGNKLGMSVRTVGRSLRNLRENHEIISEQRKIYIGVEEYHRLKEQLQYF